VTILMEPSGEHVIAGAGQLHIENAVQELTSLVEGAALLVSDSVVLYRETVTAGPDSGIDPEVCMSQSPNRDNKLYCEASSLATALTHRIDVQEITPRDDVEVRGRILMEEFGWEHGPAHKVWAFGPELVGPNLLVDATKRSKSNPNLPSVNEVKDSVVSGFAWVAKEGVICEENMRGICFKMVDVILHSENIKRSSGQIIPTARRVFYAAELASRPRLMEPMYLVEIVCPSQALEGINHTLAARRGFIKEKKQREGSPVYNIRAYIPVAESFDFDHELKIQTNCQALPQMVFDHWQLVAGDPLADSDLKEIICEIRTRKGLPPEVPPIERYKDWEGRP